MLGQVEAALRHLLKNNQQELENYDANLEGRNGTERVSQKVRAGHGNIKEHCEGEEDAQKGGWLQRVCVSRKNDGHCAEGRDKGHDGGGNGDAGAKVVRVMPERDVAGLDSDEGQASSELGPEQEARGDLALCPRDFFDLERGDEDNDTRGDEHEHGMFKKQGKVEVARQLWPKESV